DDDRADALDVVAPDEERMLVFGVRLGDVHGDLQRALDVRPRRAHPVLGLLHLGGRDHLHRLGDLARALHALDLVAYFFRAGHLEESWWATPFSTRRSS